MIYITLRDAQEEYKTLEAEERLWKNRKELIELKVTKVTATITPDTASTNVKNDKMLNYMIELDEKKIIETLEYIKKQKEIIMNYIEDILRIRKEYTTLERRIYDLRNDADYQRVHNKKMPFWKIGQIVGYSKSQCYNIYKKIGQKWTK